MLDSFFVKATLLNGEIILINEIKIVTVSYSKVNSDACCIIVLDDDSNNLLVKKEFLDNFLNKK